MFAEHRQWERWERIRVGGRKRFVWLYGVCGWGLSFGCLATVFLAIHLVSSRHPVPAIAVLPLLPGPAGGFILGSILWDQTETKYLASRAAARKEQDQIAAIDALASEVKELRELLNKQRDADTQSTENGITKL